MNQTPQTLVVRDLGILYTAHGKAEALTWPKVPGCDCYDIGIETPGGGIAVIEKIHVPREGISTYILPSPSRKIAWAVRCMGASGPGPWSDFVADRRYVPTYPEPEPAPIAEPAPKKARVAAPLQDLVEEEIPEQAKPPRKKWAWPKWPSWLRMPKMPAFRRQKLPPRIPQAPKAILPNIRPKFRMPKIRLPKLRLPKFHMPRIRIPFPALTLKNATLVLFAILTIGTLWMAGGWILKDQSPEDTMGKTAAYVQEKIGKGYYIAVSFISEHMKHGQIKAPAPDALSLAQKARLENEEAFALAMAGQEAPETDEAKKREAAWISIPDTNHIATDYSVTHTFTNGESVTFRSSSYWMILTGKIENKSFVREDSVNMEASGSKYPKLVTFSYSDPKATNSTLPVELTFLYLKKEEPKVETREDTTVRN
jgi:hypothetical protein